MIISDFYLILQENEMKLPIHRSRSVPMLNKEGNSPVPGMFRIVRTTLRLDDKIATTPMTSPIHDTGNISFQNCFMKDMLTLES